MASVLSETVSSELAAPGPATDVFQLVGTVVADTFEVERVVAEGGFAVVYRAQHLGFRAPVALKCLKIPGDMGAEARQRFREQFRSEAELMFRLSKAIAEIVRPLHIDAITTANGRFMPFLALEWLEGQTLDAYAREQHEAGRVVGNAREIFELLSPVADALSRAHHFPGPEGEVAIVHRDIKPENLFLVGEGSARQLRVLDFGIAKTKSAAEQIAGRASREVAPSSFTPLYAAPEQWAPKRFGQTGTWTDVWGLALTFVELLVGHPAFDGDATAVMGAALDPAIRPTPRSQGLEVSDRLEAVFARALAVDPRDRYPEVSLFWSELDAALEPSAPEPVTEGLREFEPDALPMPALELSTLPPRTGPDPPQIGVEPVVAAARAEPAHTSYVGPLLAVGLGSLIALGGEYYSERFGAVIALGPVTVTWISTPLVLIGAGQLIIRVARRVGGPN
jgi:serine/threonine-protein kinase